jgi:trigger factor
VEVVFDKQEQAYGVVNIKLTPEDYTPEVDKQLKDYRKKAQLKGFRPGKAPMGFIKKMVGKDIKADVISRSVSKHVNDYLVENKLTALFSPLPKDEPLALEDFANNDEFEFAFEVCLEPELDLTLSKDNKMSGYKVEPTDEEVEKMIEKFRKEMPQIVEVDEVAEGDFVKATFKQGELSKETSVPMNQVADEAKADFLGKKKDETFTLDLRKAFPEAQSLKMLFGQEFDGDVSELDEQMKGDFEVTISEITRNEDSELNQEFFDKALGEGVVSNEEEFKAKLKERMSEGNQGVADDLFIRDVRDKLVADTDIELNENLLKKIIRLSTEKELSQEDIEKQYPRFYDAVKWRIISNHIFKSGDLKIEEEDIKKGARAVVRQQLAGMGLQGMPEEQMEQFVDMMLEKEEAKQKSYDDAYEQVFAEKLSKHIRESVTVEDELVGVDKFNEIVEQYVKKDREEQAEMEGGTVEEVATEEA